MHEFYHDFEDSLRQSHAGEDLPLWEQCYRQFWPTFVGMHNHRQSGPHQLVGIDRSVILSNSRTKPVDEKLRGRNKKTGKVYGDILLEFLSDKKREKPGWVCKPLMAEYIAYAIAPLGKCYLLPVEQLQEAWRRHGDDWISRYGVREAFNKDKHRPWVTWVTVNTPVPVSVLYSAIGSLHRAHFTPCELDEDGEPEANGKAECNGKTEPPAVAHAVTPLKPRLVQGELF